jgi:hypothetical protein
LGGLIPAYEVFVALSSICGNIKFQSINTILFMNKIIFAFMAISFLVSCTSTEIVSSWKDPETTISANQIDKILFIALVKNESYRRVIEDKMVALSKGKGLASYAFVTGSSLTKTDKAGITQRLKADGTDLIVIMRLLDVTEETRYVPSSAMNGYGGMRYGGYWGGYSYAAPMYYTPGYYTKDKNFLVETNVYSVEQDKLLWSGTTSSMNPSKIDTTTAEIADDVIEKMKKEGFLLK